jgi:WD40 repeat protein
VLQQTNEGVRAAFSPDGRLAATGSEDIYRAKVWDVATGRLVSTLTISGMTTHVSFSPNGKWLLTASSDGSVRVWDPITARTAIDLREHAGSVTAAGFGPDSKTLMSAGEDGLVLISRCDVCGSLDDLLTLAARLSTRSLTAAEREEYLGVRPGR